MFCSFFSLLINIALFIIELQKTILRYEINIYENMTEVKTGRGRPRKSTNVIEVNNIKLEYIITKNI